MGKCLFENKIPGFFSLKKIVVSLQLCIQLNLQVEQILVVIQKTINLMLQFCNTIISLLKTDFSIIVRKRKLKKKENIKQNTSISQRIFNVIFAKNNLIASKIPNDDEIKSLTSEIPQLTCISKSAIFLFNAFTRSLWALAAFSSSWMRRRIRAASSRAWFTNWRASFASLSLF